MIVSFVFTKKAPVVALHGGDRIRCPKCAWEPAKSDRWCCEPGCSHTWNTFDTHGICPSCEKQWQDTVCLRCLQWSPHQDWYTTG